MPNAIVELLNVFLGDLQESICGSLLGRVVDERPYTVLNREFTSQVADLGQDADFKAIHREEQVGVVTTVNTSESVVPLNRGY